jgi:hypothetical protein
LILKFFLPTYVLDFPNALKKLIAIFLVFLLLFNAMGIYGLLQGLRYKSTLDLVQRLDDHQYSAEETILLTVPIEVPYAQNDADYERVNGEFEYQGEVYRLVKQKYQSGTLFLVCIKDHQTGRIQQALTDYVKTFTDKPVDSKHSGKIVVDFVKDFLPTMISMDITITGWNHDLSFDIIEYNTLERPFNIASPPPRG